MKRDSYQQVKMDKARHAQVKIFSVVNGRKLYEVVDTACQEYLKNQDKKEIEIKVEK
jgi:ABC-type uncharacterized transport system substrate-binding protein